MARRAAEWLVTMSALGEIAIGLLLASLPAAVAELLLGSPLDGTGTIVARMTGVALAALGLAWWPDRNGLDARRQRQVAPAFLGYNLGIGLLFAGHAWTAGRSLPISWLVAAAHLATGVAFAVMVRRGRTGHTELKEVL